MLAGEPVGDGGARSESKVTVKAQLPDDLSTASTRLEVNLDRPGLMPERDNEAAVGWVIEDGIGVCPVIGLCVRLPIWLFVEELSGTARGGYGTSRGQGCSIDVEIIECIPSPDDVPIGVKDDNNIPEDILSAILRGLDLLISCEGHGIAVRQANALVREKVQSYFGSTLRSTKSIDFVVDNGPACRSNDVTGEIVFAQELMITTTNANF